METFTNNIREWHLESTKLKTWATLKVFLHWAHKNQRREVTTTGKGGHTAAVQNIYGVPPPSTRIASWNNKLIKGNCSGNEELKVWYGRTDTGQYSCNQIQICSDGEIGVNHYSHVLDEGKSQEPISIRKEKNYCWICRSKLSHGRKASTGQDKKMRPIIKK